MDIPVTGRNCKKENEILNRRRFVCEKPKAERHRFIKAEIDLTSDIFSSSLPKLKPALIFAAYGTL